MIDRALVIGGGPVGLWTALCLAVRGIRPTVLERRADARHDTRSIGLHPPALERLDEVGLGKAFAAEGVQVERGIAFARTRPVGRVSFAGCPGPHRYVLTLPQHRTEALLRGALEACAPGSLVMGAEVHAIEAAGPTPRVDYRLADGSTATASAPWLALCEGKRGRLRRQLGIGTTGRVYPGHYAMADVPDDTALGKRAAIFLDPQGQVESFPLPARRRRWVAKLRGPRDEPPADALRRAVETRTGHALSPAVVGGATGFVAERRLARRFVSGRVALLGDTAHVVSPIGGQGTNLGLLGAWTFVEAVAGARSEPDMRRRLARAARVQRRRARAAMRRAEANMWLGEHAAGGLPGALLRLALRSPAEAWLAEAFSMRGLHLGV